MGDAEIGEWQRGLDGSARAAANAVLAAVRAADLCGPDALPGDRARFLLATVGSDIVGLAWRVGDDPAELYVAPERRSQGVGSRLAEVVLASGPVWAHGTFRAAGAIAARLGARPARRLLQLRRPLEAPFTVVWPDGVVLRVFRPGVDDAAFLAVNARAFSWHPEQGRLDQAALDAEMREAWFDAAGFLLAVPADDADRILGFHWTKVHQADPDTGRPIGEVYVLGADPDGGVRHLGTPLTAAGLNHLRDRGLGAVLLYVESDNGPALTIYRRLGFTDYATDTVFAAQDCRYGTLT